MVSQNCSWYVWSWCSASSAPAVYDLSAARKQIALVNTRCITNSTTLSTCHAPSTVSISTIPIYHLDYQSYPCADERDGSPAEATSRCFEAAAAATKAHLGCARNAPGACYQLASRPSACHGRVFQQVPPPTECLADTVQPLQPSSLPRVCCVDSCSPVPYAASGLDCHEEGNPLYVIPIIKPASKLTLAANAWALFSRDYRSDELDHFDVITSSCTDGETWRASLIA